MFLVRWEGRVSYIHRTWDEFVQFREILLDRFPDFALDLPPLSRLSTSVSSASHREEIAEVRKGRGRFYRKIQTLQRSQYGISYPGVGTGTGWESRPFLHPGFKISAISKFAIWALFTNFSAFLIWKKKKYFFGCYSVYWEQYVWWASFSSTQIMR